MYCVVSAECQRLFPFLMPKGLAVAALTTAGYSGMLAGPAVIGFLSKGNGLHNAFWFLAALFVCPPLLSKYVTSETST